MIVFNDGDTMAYLLLGANADASDSQASFGRVYASETGVEVIGWSVVNKDVIPESYDTAEQAESVAAAINGDLRNFIPIPSALAEAGVSETILAEYCKRFVAITNGSKVILALTSEAAEEVQQTADEAQDVVLAAMLDETSDAPVISATPGMVYAIEYGATPSLGKNPEGVVATDTTVQLEKPAIEGDSAFFRIKVSTKPIPAQE